MSNWIEAWTPEKAERFLLDVSAHLAELGGPLTRDLHQLVVERRYIDLINFRFDYTRSEYSDLLYARQIHALFHKQEWMDLGLDPRGVAEKKFWEMEKRCEETNANLEAGRLDADAWRVITLARHKIRRILGRVPGFSKLKISFGPGATTNVKGRTASPRAKLNARLACSRELLPVVGRLLAEVPLWTWSHSVKGHINVLTDVDHPRYNDVDEVIHWPEVEVHAGKLTFVPKDARSMRAIMVEPTLNGAIQKGVGSYLKERMLRCVNLNLSDQTRNQRLAMEGSIHGGYATVDLSSASDTVSVGIVRLLLPEEWFDFLSELTTGEINSPDGVRTLEKFSSMGNGFTFELESLLFYSIAKSVVELLDLQGEVSVFGDDIIVNSRAYSLLASVLTQFGFLVNNEKSFWEGPFRESCGADWFEGKSIRPYYQKKLMSERQLYTFHNWAIRNCEHTLAALLLGWTNSSMRLWGPDGYGDGHLIGSFHLHSSRKAKRGGWAGGSFDTYSLRPRRFKTAYDTDWVFPSYSVYTRSGERDRTDPDIVRGSSGYAKLSLYTLASTVFRRDSGPNLDPTPEYLRDS
ncbi:RNA-directed RNA polymerase [ssRNA phage Gerhypos.3_22]|uniref:RNA-directed RNA polymerase n=2 Tax=Fiersviridae TaxID=2842319 RepID=A0A8S5L044_9VIRU|nr:RNA-directed RNA polymerase [ssRNA phage Gerhypos.3_22]QDH89246.1 MAG: RNA-dependent RNA polymerase [Leviviridae sp.]DAD51318.1 TPA_asm: RNA-directed RNA polymerase [ssRNA phage Gerhypos.3_22]